MFLVASVELWFQFACVLERLLTQLRVIGISQPPAETVPIHSQNFQNLAYPSIIWLYLHYWYCTCTFTLLDPCLYWGFVNSRFRDLFLFLLLFVCLFSYRLSCKYNSFSCFIVGIGVPILLIIRTDLDGTRRTSARTCQQWLPSAYYQFIQFIYVYILFQIVVSGE